MLEEFASDTIQDQDQDQAQLVEGRSRGGRRSGKGLVPAALRVLSSVKVLGEGVDTANCDSVAFCDARGSMIDIVQMVGRALRIKPGEGKIASLIVPVFLAPGESPDEMLTSDAYGTLAKVLGRCGRTTPKRSSTSPIPVSEAGVGSGMKPRKARQKLSGKSRRASGRRVRPHGSC
ncbi:helicase-related protein [Streptomyces sanglieri]|uniref:Helicase-related protein n=1 Tax=Streptomyces sanglieri TaxID=193460 RepID=A0ABW2WLG4_9ACTN